MAILKCLTVLAMAGFPFIACSISCGFLPDAFSSISHANQERSSRDEIPGRSFYGLTDLPSKDCHGPEIDDSGIFYNFYTRERFLYNVKYTYDNISSEIRPAYHHVNKVTKILVHGFMQSSKSKHLLPMVYDYLYTQDVNVITVDWSVYSRSCRLDSIFNDVTKVAAKSLAHLMKLLLARGTMATQLHIVAFGAGAHIAGVAGKMMHPHMIARITALNPLGLKYDYPGYPKLQTSDASFVDVIYTTSGIYASKRDVGHVIFYPAGGRHPQPGCGPDEYICSAMRTIDYFRRSILTSTAYPASRCGEESSSVSGVQNYMGEYVEPNNHGRYYVDVGSLPLPMIVPSLSTSRV